MNSAFELPIYSGEEKFNLAHGYGKSIFPNGNVYVGNHHMDKPDGYGMMLMNVSFYLGHWSAGLPHGLGSWGDEGEIYKGHWRFGMKHGKFLHTLGFKTSLEWWNKNSLIESREITFIPAHQLIVKQKIPKRRSIFKPGQHKNLCFICVNNPVNCTNSTCGHCFACNECFSQCDKCPVCRAPIGQIIKLFLS